MPRTKTTARSSTMEAERRNLRLQETINKRNKELIKEFESTHSTRRQSKRESTSSPKATPKPKQHSNAERAQLHKDKVLKGIDEYVNSRSDREIVDSMIVVKNASKTDYIRALEQIDYDLLVNPPFILYGSSEHRSEIRSLINAIHVENKRIADIKKDFESNRFGKDSDEAFVFYHSGWHEWLVFTVNRSTIGNVQEFMGYLKSLDAMSVLSILCVFEYTNDKIIKDYYDTIGDKSLKYVSELTKLRQISNDKTGNWTYVNIKEATGKTNDLVFSMNIPTNMYSM